MADGLAGACGQAALSRTPVKRLCMAALQK